MTVAVAVWTPELKAEAISQYVERINEYLPEDQPSHTLEVIAELAALYGFTKNSMRGVIQQSEHYVKAAKKAPAVSDKPASKRPNKAQALAELKAAIVDGGAEVNEELIDRLTGIEAVYFTQVIRHIQVGE